MAVEQCPVTGDPCNLCQAGQKQCVAKADQILYLNPDEYDAEISKFATKLGIETELFADFVYDRAFGSGASTTLRTKSDDNPFLNLQ